MRHIPTTATAVEKLKRACARATAATDAPGAAHAARTRDFRSGPWRRRVAGLAISMVST